MSKLHLLLLEEDTFRADKIKTIFEESEIGYDVQHVQAHAEFSGAMASAHHDVILSGNFKEEEGVTGIVKTIKSQGRNIPYIIITNPVSEEYAVSLMKAGTFNYVLKERLEKLPDAILRAMEQYHLNEQRDKVLQDILPREALMKEAERIAHFGSWKFDPLTDTTWWSDENYRILGYEPGEVAPSWDNFIKMLHPDDVDPTTESLDDAIKNGKRKKYTFRVVDRSNVTKYIQSEIIITRDEHFNVIGMNGFLRDMSAQVHAEIRSVESDEKYFNLFENNPCALTVIDMEGRTIVDVNSAGTKQHGYVKGDPIPPDIYKPISDKTSGDDKRTNSQITRKDGSLLLAEVTSTDIMLDGKKCRLVLSEDISEKLQSIEQLKESEARLLNSQRIAHIGSWEVDLRKGGCIKWSDETYRIFGFEPNEVHVTPDLFRKLVHPDDLYILEDAMMNALERGGEYSAEFRIVLRDGTERLVSELGELIFDPGTHEQIKLTGTAQDVTERRNSRRQLQKSEANLRSIFENAHTAYLLLDTELRILSFNRPAYRFSQAHLNAPLEEGTPAVKYFADTTLVVVKKSMRDALNGASTNYEVSYPDEKGEDKWYHVNFHAVWSEEKVILGVIMSLRDITKRKTSELQEKKITSELMQRNKDLEQFAYIISHNLRAPVANIIGIADALKDDYIEEHEKQIFMNGLYDSAKKLDTVIIDLNRILQLKHGLNENKEKVQFSTTVNDIKFTIGGANVSEMFQIKADFSEIDEMMTLKSYLHSIFYNLISNSIKYKRPDIVPVIDIKSARVNNGIVITFKDNGLGIDMEKNGGMLFGLYKRFNQDAAEGKGMGLFMVKAQVETLGGRISVKSKVNAGTEFKIEFSQ